MVNAKMAKKKGDFFLRNHLKWHRSSIYISVRKTSRYCLHVLSESSTDLHPATNIRNTLGGDNDSLMCCAAKTAVTFDESSWDGSEELLRRVRSQPDCCNPRTDLSINFIYIFYLYFFTNFFTVKKIAIRRSGLFKAFPRSATSSFIFLEQSRSTSLPKPFFKVFFFSKVSEPSQNGLNKSEENSWIFVT